MNSYVKVKLRLPVPEGRIGDVVEIDEHRAAILVDSGYAVFVELVENPIAPDPDDNPEPVVVAEPTAADQPETSIPSRTAPKAEWVDVAQSLGLDTTDMTKPELIDAVTNVLT